MKPWRKPFSTLFFRRRSGRAEEIGEEIQAHLQMAAQDLMDRGKTPEEARAAVLREFGNVPLIQDVTRQARGWMWPERLLQDFRYALRQLRKSPVFTITAVTTLALGIGANTAMFTLVDATLLRPMPFPHARGLMTLHTTNAKGAPSWMLFPDIAAWQEQSKTIASLAYYSPGAEYLETHAGEQSISVSTTSANLFDVLGVAPTLGRGFMEQEQTPGKGKVIVLSDAIWRSLFHAGRSILGSQVKLNDEEYTVVGVMPRGFAFPVNDPKPQVWIPAERTPNFFQLTYKAPSFKAIARLRNGVSRQEAQAELTAIQQNRVKLYTKTFLAENLAPSRVAVERYTDTLVTNVRPALLALMLAVALVWLIACANVATLTLARSTERQREMAVRGALGASRGRLVRQLFTEGLLLSALGSAAGLALAELALRFFEKVLHAKLGLTGHLAPDSAVLLALLLLSVLSALFFGLLPALLSTRLPIERALRRSSGQEGASRSRHRFEQLLVVGEIGVSLVLLAGCGLLLRTVFELRGVALGFRTDHVLVARPQLPGYKYRNADVDRVVWRPLLERVEEMHGVEAASLTTVVPLDIKSYDTNVQFLLNPSAHGPQGQRQLVAKLRASSAGLQKVFGFRMLQGRFFDERDTPDSQPVAVVNRAFAKMYGSGGKTSWDKFSFRLGKNRQVKVVGVMDDFRQAAIDKPSAPEIDFCITQLKPADSFYAPTAGEHVELAVRTARDPKNLIADLRRAMKQVNPDFEAGDFETMDQVVDDAMGSQLLAAHLLEAFAGLALLVALTGLYGLLAYIVTQQTREVGVRLALGARREDIVRLVLRQAASMLLGGTALGLLLSYFSNRMLAGLLYGVKTHDIATLAAVSLLLLACGLMAAFVPARRASRIEPMEALRAD